MTDGDPLISGYNPLARVVAVEPDSDSKQVIVFQRSPAQSVEEIVLPFIPWLVAADERSFPGASTSRLEGGGYRWRVDFSTSGWRGFLDARRRLRDENIPILSYGGQVKQFLIASGITLFKEMAFEDLNRMQIDIETATLSPTDPAAKIVLIAIADSTGRVEVLDGDETEMLEELADRIRHWDPDVIEGHNIYSFDLPYLLERCKANGVLFSVGRHPDRVPTIGTPRNCAIGANNRPFTPIYVYGRHIIDTYLQVQRFDAPRGLISSYGLKECARVFNLSSANRIIVDRTRITELTAESPELVREYAKQDVEETRALAALVTPTDFYQTQMIPDGYQTVAVTGNGEKVNSLLIREYLRCGHAIPIASGSSEYPGGYTEVRKVGVIHHVVKADVESLYPSLMLTKRIKPSSDTLDIFLPLLTSLTNRRLTAKAQAKNAARDTSAFAYWDGLQNSYKVLINSFYGYIGGPFHFNDYYAARSVTVTGQEVVKSISDALESMGSIIIEVDTDGIYFQPPKNIRTEEQEEHYIQDAAKMLPTGIRVDHDGRYASMLSLKIKNYVLVDYDGHKIFKGSSLRSRADEPFCRAFLGEAVELILAESYEDFSALYNSLIGQILDGRLPIAQIARRERVTSKMKEGAQRHRMAGLVASGALIEGDIVQIYNRSDGTPALESDYNFDEDRDYYAEKLYKFALRLIDAVGEERFNRLCPKPKPAKQRLQERLQASFEF